MLDKMNDISDSISSADQMVEQMTYMLFGSIATTTKAFGHVEIKMSVESQRVFVAIELRWFAKFKSMDTLRKYWLSKAERRAVKYMPKDWKLLIYYKQEGDGR